MGREDHSAAQPPDGSSPFTGLLALLADHEARVGAIEADLQALPPVREGDPAGGDLGGEYPNPTVENVAGAAGLLADAQTPLAHTHAAVDMSGPDKYLGRLTAGAGASEEIAFRGTAFPGSPTDGLSFYRTDLDELFYYDGARAKWLSARTFEFEGTTAVAITSTYLNFPGGVAMSSTLGYVLPWDMTCCTVYGHNADAATAATLRVRANGTNMVALACAAATSVVSTGLNTDFTAADVVAMFTSSTLTAGCGIKAVFRRRAT
jgi:hypothetical protein